MPNPAVLRRRNKMLKLAKNKMLTAKGKQVMLKRAKKKTPSEKVNR